MKKLIRELRNEGSTTKCAPMCVYRYLLRNRYLNVSEILAHLENLLEYGYMRNDAHFINAVYEFYDMWAYELFVSPRIALRATIGSETLKFQQKLDKY